MWWHTVTTQRQKLIASHCTVLRARLKGTLGMRLTVTRSHLNPAIWPQMAGIRYPACILCRGMDRIVRKRYDVFIPFPSSKNNDD